MENEILPAIQHNSFVILKEDPHEFVNSKERQTYGSFHHEFTYDENGNCTVKKCASRILSK